MGLGSSQKKQLLCHPPGPTDTRNMKIMSILFAEEESPAGYPSSAIRTDQRISDALGTNTTGKIESNLDHAF